MISRFPNIERCLMLVMLLTIAGCLQQRKPDVDVSDFEPDVETLAAIPVPDYASRAFEATGGRQAWTKNKKLQLDCVVTFYKPDASFYLTEQQYQIYPWSNSIQISATEPQGKVLCQLSPDKFSIAEGDYRLYCLPPELPARLFTEMILDITAAPTRFLDKSAEFARSPKQVKREGLWYQPIERKSLNIGLAKPYSKSVFYQRAESSLVDMIWFAGPGQKEFFAVRGYDWHEQKKHHGWIPAKIEIFKTDARGALQHRLVKIDVK